MFEIALPLAATIVITLAAYRTGRMRTAAQAVDSNAICAIAERDATMQYLADMAHGNCGRTAKSAVRATLKYKYHLKPMYVHIISKRAIKAAQEMYANREVIEADAVRMYMIAN